MLIAPFECEGDNEGRIVRDTDLLYGWVKAKLSLVHISIHRHEALLGRPVWKIEERAWGTTQSAPFDTPYMLEAGRSEGKGAAIEEHGPATLIDLP